MFLQQRTFSDFCNGYFFFAIEILFFISNSLQIFLLRKFLKEGQQLLCDALSATSIFICVISQKSEVPWSVKAFCTLYHIV